MLYTRLFLSPDSEGNPKFRTTVALIFLKYNNGLALNTTVEQILKYYFTYIQKANNI